MFMSKMKGALQQSLTGFLAEHLSARTKRLVFLASLTARVKETNELNDETLSKLNKLMALSNDASALKLPVYLSKAVWHGKDSRTIFNGDVVNSDISSGRIKDMAFNVIASMPAWLRYGSDGDMANDVKRFIDNRSTLIGA